MTEPFEARIRRLEDIEAIRRRKVQYFDACDGGFGGIASHEPEAIAATFAEDGTWGLVRASSNKPELVVVVESPVSPERRRQMFEAVDTVLRRSPEVGDYNQTF